MNQHLKILMLEDTPEDAGLIQHELKKAGFNFSAKVVDTKDDFQNAIIDFDPDVILSDHQLPEFNSTDALKIYHELGCKAPILLITGAVSEEFAAQTIREGAADYLLKNNLIRLPSAIIHAIEKRQAENGRDEVIKKIQRQNVFMNLMLESLPIAYYTCKTNGNFGSTFISDNVFSITGFESHRFVEAPDFWINQIHPEDKERILSGLQRVLNNGEHEMEYRWQIADGSWCWFFDKMKLVKNADGQNFIAGAWLDITERKKMEDEMKAIAVRHQQKITEVTIDAQEKERNQLGRELHDNINQILATSKIYLGLAKSKPERSHEMVEKSFLLVDQAMTEIRTLSHSLVAPSLGEITLKEVLEEMAAEINKAGLLNLQLRNELDGELSLGEKMELMLYRIVQEQMNNIHKYAKAKTIDINLKIENDYLCLNITDDGVGFDPGQKHRGIGLKNIESRAEFYSGKSNIISSPGKGCRLEVMIPV
jgi:two-component system, NarL family, sensor histidine kinase UhpB